MMRHPNYLRHVRSRPTLDGVRWREARFDAQQMKQALGANEAHTTAQARFSGQRGDVRDHWARVLSVLEKE